MRTTIETGVIGCAVERKQFDKVAKKICSCLSFILRPVQDLSWPEFFLPEDTE